MKSFRHKNIFAEIENKGHDEDWVPKPASVATAARPGTIEKIEVFAQRLADGECLFHENDEVRPGTLEQSIEMASTIIRMRIERVEEGRARKRMDKRAKESRHDKRRIKPARPAKGVFEHEGASSHARRVPSDSAELAT